ncbi:MAG: heme exporter protein CcmD [Candidatus Tectomicrobia bacterium]|nr:heme exporter protein CcmD [Candidatus Tectomicrobia bacterium]
MDNLGYITAAYGITLITLVVYLVWLWRKTMHAQIQVRALKSLEDRHES